MNGFHDDDTPSSAFLGYSALNPRLANEAWDAYDVDTRVEEFSRLTERLHVGFLNQLHLHLFDRRDESVRHPVAG